MENTETVKPGNRPKTFSDLDVRYRVIQHPKVSYPELEISAYDSNGTRYSCLRVHVETADGAPLQDLENVIADFKRDALGYPLAPAAAPDNLGAPVKDSVLGWHLYMFKLEDPVIGPTKSLRLRVAELYYRRLPEGDTAWVQEVVRVWLFAGEENHVQYLAERSEPFNMAGSLRFRVMAYGLDEAKRVFPAFQLLLDGTVLPADKDEVNRQFKAYLGRPFGHIMSWSQAAERFNKLEAEGVPRMPDTRFARELDAEELEARMDEALRARDKEREELRAVLMHGEVAGEGFFKSLSEAEEAKRAIQQAQVTGTFEAAPEPVDRTAPDPVVISNISVIDRGGQFHCPREGVFLRVETEPYPGQGSVVEFKVSDFQAALALKKLIHSHYRVIKEQSEVPVVKGESAWKGVNGPDAGSLADFRNPKRLMEFWGGKAYADVTERIAKPLAEQHPTERIEGLTEIYRSAAESLTPKENAAEPPADQESAPFPCMYSVARPLVPLSKLRSIDSEPFKVGDTVYDVCREKDRRGRIIHIGDTWGGEIYVRFPPESDPEALSGDTERYDTTGRRFGNGDRYPTLSHYDFDVELSTWRPGVEVVDPASGIAAARRLRVEKPLPQDLLMLHDFSSLPDPTKWRTKDALNPSYVEFRQEQIRRELNLTQRPLHPDEVNTPHPVEPPAGQEHTEEAPARSEIGPKSVKVQEFGKEWKLSITRGSAFNFGPTHKTHFIVPKDKTALCIGALVRLVYLHAGEDVLFKELDKRFTDVDQPKTSKPD